MTLKLVLEIIIKNVRNERKFVIVYHNINHILTIKLINFLPRIYRIIGVNNCTFFICEAADLRFENIFRIK